MNTDTKPLKLEDFPEWLASVAKKAPKLREGAKMLINTETLKTYPVYTIEIWHHPQRRYLPLKMPDGSWSFDSAHHRNATLEKIRSAIRVYPCPSVVKKPS